MKKYLNSRKNKNNKILFLIGVFLVSTLFFITVGFSALTTTLSIDGSVSFTPVGLIRVMSIKKDTLNNSTEHSASITPDSIKNKLDLNNGDSYATYDVVIKNLGQIDYQLDHIDEIVYSNSQTEYVLDGFQIGNVIHAGESKTFKVTFRYKSDAVGNLESRLNSELKFAFEEYESEDTTLFKHDGACTFNGTSPITGNDCQEYWNKTYIDTGVKLYSNDNWQTDYEIGFTVDEFIPANNVNQAVFVNAKYENESLKWPGLVFRRTANKSSVEITQSINNGNKAIKEFPSSLQAPFSVKIFRIDGIIYYVINNGEMTQLQNMKNFNQQFETTTWFGAAADQNGNQMRNLNATLSGMYIKLGKYEPKKYTVTFDATSGTVNEATRTVNEYKTIGTFPIPIGHANAEFDGWYTDPTYQTRAEENIVVNSNMTLYAKWIDTSGAKVGDNYYASLADAIQSVPTDGNEYTVTVLRDTSTKLSVRAGQNIVLDCGNYTLSNNAQTFILENYGNLKIINGIFNTNSTGASAINNEETGTMTITGTRVIATGAKQAVYNNGGTITINGDTYLSATSNNRAALQNLNNGTMTITGGTIESSNYAALLNQAGTLVIGTDDESINITAPSFKGKTYGIQSSINFSMYDGVSKGITAAVSNESKITNVGDNYSIYNYTEKIDENTYKALYLEHN